MASTEDHGVVKTRVKVELMESSVESISSKGSPANKVAITLYTF